MKNKILIKIMIFAISTMVIFIGNITIGIISNYITNTERLSKDFIIYIGIISIIEGLLITPDYHKNNFNKLINGRQNEND